MIRTCYSHKSQRVEAAASTDLCTSSQANQLQQSRASKFDSIGSFSCLSGRLTKVAGVSWNPPEAAQRSSSSVATRYLSGPIFKLWLYYKHLPAVQANILLKQRTYLRQQVSRFQVVLYLPYSRCFFGGFGQCVSTVHSTNRKSSEGFGFNNTFFWLKWKVYFSIYIWFPGAWLGVAQTVF